MVDGARTRATGRARVLGGACGRQGKPTQARKHDHGGGRARSRADRARPQVGKVRPRGDGALPQGRHGIAGGVARLGCGGVKAWRRGQQGC